MKSLIRVFLKSKRVQITILAKLSYCTSKTILRTLAKSKGNNATFPKPSGFLFQSPSHSSSSSSSENPYASLQFNDTPTTTMPSSHKRPPASPLSMEGLSVRSSPRFVSDILLVCEPTEEDFYSGKRARLTSLLDPANGQRSVVENKEDGR